MKLPLPLVAGCMSVASLFILVHPTAVSSTPKDAAIAKAPFTEAYKVFMYPRCVNCHPAETPPIEVHIVNSSTKGLGGTGEVGPVTLVPAVVNAIFAATSKRYSSLPLSRHGLMMAPVF